MASLPEHLRSTPAGTGQVPREVLSEHQRERVLSLATPVFAKRGYQGTTVDDLLAAGRIGVGNFYDLFEGKEDCFLACFERICARTLAEIDESVGAATAWHGQAYLGLHRLIEAILAAPLDARLVLVEAQSAGPAALERYNGLLERAIAWLREGRGSSATASGLPGGFEQAAVSGLAFYLQQCLLDSRRHEVEELFGEALGLVVEPITGAAPLRALRDSPAGSF